MNSDQKLNISEVVLPFSLALCKYTLSRMATGEVLEICLADPDTLRDLLMIAERCGNDILAWKRQDDGYYVWVRKNQECQ